VASKSLKIRPKSFFGSLRTAPLLNKQTHLYRLFEKPETARDAKEEHLKDYTAKNAKPRKFSASNNEQLSLHDSAELAEFQLEIDLHIDKLHDNWEKLNNAEILKIQLSHFESFLNKAIRLGVSAVFIIHGVGKGRLKNEIATRLMQNPDVVTFKNEYHPRYGWGATEVLL
jgi:DNA-nicking Smr family endonuclease